MLRLCGAGSGVQRRTLLAAFALAIFLGYMAWQVRGGQPVISKIERWTNNGTNNGVLVHFDTDANLTYTLQSTETLVSNGVPVQTWSNYFTAPNLPYANHYVVADTRPGKQRFYRLYVTP